MKWINELFFLWQDNCEYKKDETYHDIVRFMDENLTKKQISELEDLISLDTHEHMLEAFIGGFCMCRDLMLLFESNDKRLAS